MLNIYIRTLHTGWHFDLRIDRLIVDKWKKPGIQFTEYIIIFNQNVYLYSCNTPDKIEGEWKNRIQFAECTIALNVNMNLYSYSTPSAETGICRDK